MESSVTVIIPAYNEEEAIGKVIDEIRSSPVPCQILVGDNNSTDGTYEIAKNKGVTPMRVYRQGKGNVVKALLTQVITPYVIMVDADYTYPVGFYLKAIVSLLELDADVVMCYRAWRQKDSMSRMNSIGNSLLSWLASILYGCKVVDVCTGLWGFKRGALDKFGLTSEGFTLEVEFFANAMERKCCIQQLPIEYRARLGGSKPKLKISDGFRIALFLIKRRLSAK